jgi:hypothetical protein
MVAELNALLNGTLAATSPEALQNGINAREVWE